MLILFNRMIYSNRRSLYMTLDCVEFVLLLFVCAVCKNLQQLSQSICLGDPDQPSVRLERQAG